MKVRIVEGAALPLRMAQAILFTSANGARALARRTSRRDIAVFGVGPQTAEAARAMGFATVVSADGDAAALADLVGSRLDPGAGLLFHAAGSETTGRLRQRLEASGFSVESEIVYAADPVPALPAAAVAALSSDILDGVFAFSPRSARILVDLVTKAELAPRCARLDACCLSAAVAEALAPLAFARVLVAGAANETAMLDLAGPGRVA
jgi:uroporphyrinogen-III synthase